MASINPYVQRELLKGAYVKRRPPYIGDTAAGSYTVKNGESGRTFTNLGNAGAFTFNLPANPKKGTVFTFTVQAAQNLVVDPPSGQKIACTVGGTYALQGDGTAVTANAAGEHLTLECLDGTNWYATTESGTWT